jgi:diketogulonate reductase-like aldo/keto reductase
MITGILTTAQRPAAGLNGQRRQNGRMTDATTVTLASGYEMPMVGLGTWQVSGRKGYEAMRTALDTGYRHIDTATMYGNETEVGRAIRDSGIDRADLFVTTKLPPERSGRVRDTLTGSLRAIGVSYVDLWLIHWPPRGRASVPTWQEFIAVRDEGLVRSIGVSNYTTAQIDQLTNETGVTPAVNQIPWSPFEHDPKRLAELSDRQVVLEGYSPFKRSDLRSRVLAEIASTHGATPGQVVLRWHLQHGIVVIPKSVNPDRIRTNFDLYGIRLTAGEMARIDALS